VNRSTPMSNFRRFAAAIALSVFVFLTNANASKLTRTMEIVDQAANVIYCPCGGDVLFFSPNDPLTSMQIESKSGLFSNWTWTKVPPWDVQTALKQTHFDFAGFADVDAFSLGPVLPFMTPAEFIAEITVDGSRLAGGKIDSSPGGGPYLYWMPEPTCSTLASIGSLCFLVFKRRR
jgi:hypothetical protein